MALFAVYLVVGYAYCAFWIVVGVRLLLSLFRS
jgi:hypothetical protein